IADGMAGSGSGIGSRNFSDVTLRDVRLTGNEAIGSSVGTANGGAIQVFGSGAHLSVIDSVVTDNTVDGRQGGLGGAAIGGGIIALSGSRVDLVNSLVTHNHALGGAGGVAGGGGIYAIQSTASVTDSTIDSNESIAGPGEFVYGLAGGVAV